MRAPGARRVGLLAALLTGASFIGASSASALVVRSATDSSPNGDGILAATARCDRGDRVISGGFDATDEAWAVISKAVKGTKWRVHAFPGDSDELTVYAYCSHGRGAAAHSDKGRTKPGHLLAKATARCGGDGSVVAGGFENLEPPPGQDNSPVFKSYAVKGTTWRVWSFFDDPPGKLKAYAYCQRHVDVKVRDNRSSSIGDGETGRATARCRRGEELLSGGFTTKPKSDFQNNNGPDFFYFGSHRVGSRAWKAKAHNYGQPGKMTVFAYCAA